MNKIYWFIVLGVCLSFSTEITPTIFDDSTLFENGTMMVDSTDMITTSLDDEFEKESTALTGTLENRGLYSRPSGTLTAYGNLEIQLDVRLKKNNKAFVNLQVLSSGLATSNSLAFNVKEFFLDINLNRQAYFRVGKQVLQWGRNYFWNPTDLINVDHRDILNLTQSRSGTYGIKTHIPFGANLNIYSFLDFSAANKMSGIAAASKVEWVANGTEMALSFWGKRNLPLVFGADISTRLNDWDLSGELSYSGGELSDHIVNTTTLVRRNTPTYRTSLGITRYFEWEYKDRIRLTLEGFYQTNGYDASIFSDKNKRAFLLQNNLYVPNNMGKAYGACFINISKFPISETNVNFNFLMNASDRSGVLSTGVQYAPVDHATLGVSLSHFVGPDNTEYTFAGNRLTAEANLTMSF